MSIQERNAARFKKLGLSEEETSVVLHALGIQLYARGYSQGGWRNYFCTHKTDDNYSMCCRLAALGWLYVRLEEKGTSGLLAIDSFIFAVTHAGKTAIKLAGFKLREDE